MFREGLSLLIAHHFRDVEMLHAERLSEAIAMVKRHVDLDIVLLDLALPDSEGLDAVPRLHEATPDARIVVLSADDSPGTVRRAIEEGAAGFIPKTAHGGTLRDALDVVLGGGVYLPGSPVGDQVAPGSRERALELSPRQLEVLHLLIRGATNKHICRELSMAESTGEDAPRGDFQAPGSQ